MHKTEKMESWLGTRLCTANISKVNFILTFSTHTEKHENLKCIA